MPTLRWQPIATLVLSLCGLGVSIYLTITHFDKVALACSANSVVNCEKVTSSPQSVILGIPVAMLGLVYFVPMVALCLPAAWRTTDRRFHLARLALSVIGVGMIIYLLIAELFLIKAICLWCSSVHLITFVLFVIIATSAPYVLDPAYGTDSVYDEDGSDDWDADARSTYDGDGYHGGDVTPAGAMLADPTDGE